MLGLEQLSGRHLASSVLLKFSLAYKNWALVQCDSTFILREPKPEPGPLSPSLFLFQLNEECSSRAELQPGSAGVSREVNQKDFFCYKYFKVLLFLPFQSDVLFQ